MTASRYVPPALRPLEAAKAVYRGPRGALAAMGHLITFLVRSIGAVPLAFRHYSKEVWRLLADVAWGNGAIVVGGGTVGVMVILGVMGGATVGIEGYTALNLLGMSPVTGGLSAFATTREIAPLLAATAFTAQSGCRFTAQLGSMRIAEEIDALEAIAIRPLPYLVTTRMCAAVGYFASGGPEGVGVAAGHAIRLAIIVIVFANLVMTLVFWGTSPGIKISG